MRGWYLLGQGLVNFSPTLLAVVVLNVADFGTFSYASITYAWGVSLSLSVSLEVLTGERWLQNVRTIRKICVMVGLGVAIVAAAVLSLLDLSWQTHLLAAVAPFAASQAYCARYVALRQSAGRRLVIGDLTAWSVTATAIVILSLRSSWDIDRVLAVWILLSVCLAGSHRWTCVPPGSTTVALWFTHHRRRLGALLADSTLMDIGSLGAPLLLGVVTTRSDFASYRSIQVLVGPLNTVLAGARGVMAARKPTVRALGILTTAGLAATVVVATAIALLLPLAGSVSPPLAGLGGYEVLVGIVVAGRLLSVPAYFVVRLHGGGRRLLTGRLVDAVMMIAGPVGGAAWGGLGPALGGAVIASVISIVVWSGFAWRSIRSEVFLT